MKNKYLLLLLATAVFGVGLGYLGNRLENRIYAFHGSLLEPPIPAGSVSLTDQHGRTFDLDEQRGKVVMMFFGYTSCPDVCPATLARFKQIAALLDDRLDRVRFVMITVDPERDTVEKLDAYLSAFHPDFIGLRGSEAELNAVYKRYWIYVEAEQHAHTDEPEAREEPGTPGYLVAHTPIILLIDPEGNLRLTYSSDMDAEFIAEDIAYLLDASANLRYSDLAKR